MYKHLPKRPDSDKRVDLSLEVKNWHVQITATLLGRPNEYVLVLFHQYRRVSVHRDLLVKEETIFYRVSYLFFFYGLSATWYFIHRTR